MRRFLLMFSAIALLAGACTSGFGDEGKDLQTISFTADLAAPDQSRTVLVDGKKVYWEAGDEIWVSGADDPFTTELDGPAATAVFTGEAALSDKYYAAYPFSAVKEGTDELLMLSLPSHQIAVNGSFDSGLNLTVASTDDQTRSFRFHNVVGFVKFTIGAAAGEINTVTIRSNAGEALSGDFYVDCESLETVADEDVREYVVLYSSGIFQEGNYYIAMLPGTYEDGLEFIFTGPKGNAVKNVTSSLTLQAGHINDVGTVSSLDWDGEEVFYTKVEQDYDDWSGDYLIAYSTSTSIKVFNSWTGDDKGASTVDLASKMTAEGIPAEDGDVYKAEFRKVGNYYSVYVTGVGYIGCASSSNTVSKQTDAPSESYTKFLWSPTYKNGVWLTNAAYSRRLQWNSDAGIFRCYTGSQKEITLYRRSKSSSGFVPPVPDPDDPTPDPDPDDPQPDDPTPDPDPDEPVPTPVPGTSGKYGWYELPVINYSESGGYLIDDNDKDLYYAHHHCAGNEKGPGGNKARNYTVCFSAKHHCPVWVAAPRHKMYESGASRTDAYAKDPSIPSSIQYNSTKTGGGCNKGNMLGSAERLSSTATNRQVFYYTNIAPQYSDTFNTGGGGWNLLEDWVDGQVCSDTLYVVIGAYFDQFTDPRGTSASPKKITFGGRSDVSCPTMFYYILLRTKKGNSGKPLSQCSALEMKCAAFVRSHKTPKGTKDFAEDMMSVRDLEKITGFTYFPNVPQLDKTACVPSDWGL